MNWKKKNSKRRLLLDSKNIFNFILLDWIFYILLKKIFSWFWGDLSRNLPPYARHCPSHRSRRGRPTNAPGPRPSFVRRCVPRCAARAHAYTRLRYESFRTCRPVSPRFPGVTRRLLVTRYRYFTRQIYYKFIQNYHG